MEPITIRLPSDMITELESEMQEFGISSRSEYIRILLNKHPFRANEEIFAELLTQDNDDVPQESEDIEEVVESIAIEKVEDFEQRIKNLERKIEQLESNNSKSGKMEDAASVEWSESSTAVTDDKVSSEQVIIQSETDDELYTNLRVWLRVEGPQSENAQSVILHAIKLLEREGSLKVGELKQELFAQDNEYTSSKSLWQATIGRFDEEIPGLQKPSRGTYTFSREKAEEELQKFSELRFPWNDSDL